MSDIIEAEYKVIQERSLPVIASEILEIEGNVLRVALDGAIRIGEKLKEAKEKVEHGKWEDWCRDNLNYSKSKTEKLMKIASEYGDPNSPYAKTYMCTDLSISKALRLLQVPEEEVETFAETHDINDMTVKELENEIKELKEQICTMDTENDRFKEEIEHHKSEADQYRESLELYKAEIEELKSSGADPDKMADLESKLQKQQEKNKKLQESLKEEKAASDKAIVDAVEAQRVKLQEQAEKAAEEKLQLARQENSDLCEKISRLERKMQSSSDENTLKFKLKADQLQEVFADCKKCIDSTTDSGKAEKMRGALCAILDNFKGGL